MVDLAYRDSARLAGSNHYEAIHSEAPRQLTLGMVHEINNVLGGIAVLSELYQSSASGDEGLGEGLALIHKSAGRLQSLVGHLKTLNEPATGEAAFLNLADVVRRLVDMFAPLLPKTLAVETDLPAQELVVHLDEATLRRVLLNLTLNLCDAGRTRAVLGTRLKISLHGASRFAELAFSTGTDDTAASEDAQARVADAQNRLHEMGGTLIAYTGSGFVLELPLVS